jgi:hypothetical protein
MGYGLHLYFYFVQIVNLISTAMADNDNIIVNTKPRSKKGASDEKLDKSKVRRNTTRRGNEAK